MWSMVSNTWKSHSFDLFQEYERRGLIKPAEFSLEGWNWSNFTLWSGRVPDGHVLYHCIFTCPITGTHYLCGDLDQSQAVEMDGTFWYSK